MKKLFFLFVMVLLLITSFASNPAPPDDSKNETTCFVEDIKSIEITDIERTQPEDLILAEKNLNESKLLLPETDLSFKNFKDLKSYSQYSQRYNYSYTGSKHEQNRNCPLLN